MSSKWFGLELACIAFTGFVSACSGDGMSTEELESDAELADETAPESWSSDVELGTSEQELLGVLPSSCGDITGTDPVLAALAVSTATELKRWQPTKDFTLSWGRLALTATGKAQCADGVCFNTQALLDLQKDEANRAEIRPGVRVNPLLLRTALNLSYARQKVCFTIIGLPLIGCGVPEHKFQLIGTEKGYCDTNYWFDVQTPAGGPLTSASMQALEKGLVWVNTEINKYVSFQVSGHRVGIDPTYGLNTGSVASSGACSAACTRVSATDLRGQCCSCNGTKTYRRSAWNASTYLCQ